MQTTEATDTPNFCGTGSGCSHRCHCVCHGKVGAKHAFPCCYSCPLHGNIRVGSGNAHRRECHGEEAEAIEE